MTDTKAETAAAFGAPSVGQQFHEMYSFWVVVVAVEDSKITVLEGGMHPTDLPEHGKLRTFTSPDRFRAAYQYTTNAGYWVRYGGTRDVSGWEIPWPKKETTVLW
ncbi:hypothetical protein ACIOD2_32150 [Amycolatopsis sp. NPDC088138]|uniref:hypothetical protein n=1 Tax=Amycolatopsis sp. NPDC088138 TaxID=3363938 RepID=UPI003827A93E